MKEPVKKINQKNPDRSSEGGFTLFEMALIVVISSILLGFLGSALLAFMRESRIKTTEHRIETIHQALSHYLSINLRYPCPASRTLGATDSQFGREVTLDCNRSDIDGPDLNLEGNDWEDIQPPVNGQVQSGTVTTVVSGDFNGVATDFGIRVGAVPTRNLNLPDEYIADAWGRKFTYAVTENLAKRRHYRADGGRVEVVGDSGVSHLSPPGTAHYVIVSHGRTGEGGYPVGAAAGPFLPCGGSLDSENCDQDYIFRSTLVNNESNPAGFYDDYVYFKGLNRLQDFPAGSVMAFNDANCPIGWADYIQAEGNFIIGADKNEKSMVTFITPPRTGVNFTPNLTVGFIGQQELSTLTGAALVAYVRSPAYLAYVEANIPPYVALKYCEKLPL